MKLLSVFLCIGFLLTTIPVSAKLSVEDFEQIRSIIKEEIAASEERTKVRIDGLQTQMDMLFKLQLALMAFIAVVIGIPQIIVATQRKKQREQKGQIEALQAERNALKQQWLAGA